jgi:hypothetical protein
MKTKNSSGILLFAFAVLQLCLIKFTTTYYVGFLILLSFLFLATSSSSLSKIQQLITLFFLTDVLYFMSINRELIYKNAIFSIVINYFTIKELLGKSSKDSLSNFLHKMNRNKVKLCAAAILIFLALRVKLDLALASLMNGYDLVGHFSMFNSLSNCSGFASSCGYFSKATPIEYEFYPQQWHLLFATILPSTDLEESLLNFRIAILATIVIAFLLISYGVNIVKKVLEISNRSIKDRTLAYICTGLMFFIPLQSLSKGYVNHALAFALIVGGLGAMYENVPRKFSLVSVTFLIAAATYSLLFIPLSFFILIWGINARKSQSKLEVDLNIFVWTVNLLLFFYHSLFHSQIKFISVESGTTPFVFPFILVFLLLLSYRIIEIAKFNLNPFDLLAICFVGTLVALQILIFVSDLESGYFLYKISLLSAPIFIHLNIVIFKHLRNDSKTRRTLLHNIFNMERKVRIFTVSVIVLTVFPYALFFFKDKIIALWLSKNFNAPDFLLSVFKNVSEMLDSYNSHLSTIIITSILSILVVLVRVRVADLVSLFEGLKIKFIFPSFLVFLPLLNSLPSTGIFYTDFFGVTKGNYLSQSKQILEISIDDSVNTGGVLILGDNFFFKSQWVNSLNNSWSSGVQKELERIINLEGPNITLLSQKDAIDREVFKCIINVNENTCVDVKK